MLSLILSIARVLQTITELDSQDLGKGFCLSLINNSNGIIIGVSQYTSTDDNRDI